MTLKTYTIHLPEFSIDPKLWLKDYSRLFKEGIRLKNLLVWQNVSVWIKSGRTPSRFNEEYWNWDYDFLTMQDVDLLTFSINKECVDKITDYAIEEEKTLYQAKKWSLIISNAMTLWLSFLTDRDIYINQNVFEINVDQEKANKKFILWYFNLVIRPLFQSTFSAKYLSKNELGRIKIPKIPRTLQDSIVAQIEPIEQKIADLKSQIVPASEIINRVFAREFGFDLDKFEELKKKKIFEVSLMDFANNRDIRQSAKFHREAWKFVLNELNKKTNKKIKDFISESIVLWTSVSPKDYDENWDFYYISMANIKNWRFEKEWSQLVSIEFSKSSQNKIVQKNDILIARSWEWTIWKVALIEDDEINWIFADFTMRIRLENYNHQFAYYFFRTEYFQYLVEINKKWLWNNTNIFPSQIQQFPILDISLSEQQRIVDEIKAEIDSQKIIEDKIQQERWNIDEIIERAIAW